MQAQISASERYTEAVDDLLIQQARMGDQGAFECLVDRYSSWLSRLISRIVRDEYAADDVLQQVWLQMYCSLPTLRPQGTLKGWLWQVARNICFDELRRKRSLCFSEVTSADDEEDMLPFHLLLDPDPQPEELSELHELEQCLHESIQALPPRFRTIVLLRFKAQLSFREIGQVLRMPVATAKTNFHRAKLLMRASLASQGALSSEQPHKHLQRPLLPGTLESR